MASKFVHMVAFAFAFTATWFDPLSYAFIWEKYWKVNFQELLKADVLI